MRKHLHRYRWEYLIIGVLLLALTAWFPPWPDFLFFVTLMWAGCPDFNALSQGCGPITTLFVATRIVQAAPFVFVAYYVWKLYRAWKNHQWSQENDRTENQ